MSYRTPHDGLPYYCLSCGLGIAEYLACEDLAFCKLESEARARKRAAAQDGRSGEAIETPFGGSTVGEHAVGEADAPKPSHPRTGP